MCHFLIIQLIAIIALSIYLRIDYDREIITDKPAVTKPTRSLFRAEKDGIVIKFQAIVKYMNALAIFSSLAILLCIMFYKGFIQEFVIKSHMLLVAISTIVYLGTFMGTNVRKYRLLTLTIMILSIVMLVGTQMMHKKEENEVETTTFYDL